MIRSIVLLAIVLVTTHSVVLSAQEEKLPRAKATKPRGESLGQWKAEGKRGMVVAGGAESVDAGLAILKDKGNAADAAAATILALSVTDANQFCFGGEVPILVYDARRQIAVALSGLGAAPRLATVQYFQKKKQGIPGQGLEAATVPATLDACLTLLDRFGTKRFADIAAPTLAILDRGEHPWHANLAKTLRQVIEAENQVSDRRVGLRLAADYFYRGPIARKISKWSRENGGLLRFADLASHVTRVEQPIAADYRGYTVYKCGPWTQGPYLLQTLKLLEGFDLAAMGSKSPDAIHVCIESLKLGLADRDVYYGDPLYAYTPLRQLLSGGYTQKRRALIDMQTASLELRPGDPRRRKALLENYKPPVGEKSKTSDTTTCLVADGDGNVVAATPSGWSGKLCEETGVWLGSRLQSFNLWAGHPNRLMPGKRPRITLTPSLVVRDNRAVMAVSVAGGDLQDQVSLQLLVNAIDFDMPPEKAVTTTRFMTGHFISSFRQAPAKLGAVRINAEVGEKTLVELKKRGHVVTVQKGAVATPTMLTIDVESGLIRGAGDPKTKRHAAAY